MSYEEEIARQVEEERKQIKQKIEEHLKREKEAREEEKRKKEQEQMFREQERINAEKRQLEMLQQGWTPRHRALYEEMTKTLGIDERKVTWTDLQGARGEQYKILKQEFLSIPLDLGTQQLEEKKYYVAYAMGVQFLIYKEDGKWKLQYDYRILPHPARLIVENDEPVGLEFGMNNTLFPNDVLKGILKLKK
ncbi:MAG: hypothetical protein QXP88_03800 [Thermoproteota archaeon]